MTGRQGNRNAGKRLPETPPAPWLSWPETSRAERCIRWIQTYCRPPKGYGARKPMRLATFQQDWIRKSFAAGVTTSVLEIPKGNGKSTLLAAIALWAVFDPDDEGGAPQVPIVATTVQQAFRTIYGPALSMIRNEPALADRCLIYSAIGAMKVVVPFCEGELYPVSNDVDGLQGLDFSLAVCDEIGFMPEDSWLSLQMSAVKRPNSLAVAIGTPGFDRSNALWLLRVRVLEGAQLPGLRFTEYAAAPGCDPDDEDEWRRANPAIDAGFLNIDAMRSLRGSSPEGLFRILHLGQWVDGVESWLGKDGRAVWDACRDPYTLDPGAWTWIGIDVGLKRDSTAVAVLQHRDDGRLHATVRLWVPTADEPVDVTDVMHHVRQLCSVYDVQGASYDPRFFDVAAKMLADEGVPMVEVPQSVERMTPAIGSLFELIKRRELSHDGDPAYAEQVLNAVPRFNERGFTLQKQKSRGRIDACIATALAADLALRQPASPPDLYFDWA